MARKPHNVSLVHYFFTETHVTSLPGYDKLGNLKGTMTDAAHTTAEIKEGSHRWSATTVFTSVDDKSENAPYSFKIVAYGIFEPESTETEEQIGDFLKNVEIVSFQVLYGAIREYLASITARSPWLTFLASTPNIVEHEDMKAAE